MAEVEYNVEKIRYNSEVVSWVDVTESDTFEVYKFRDIPAEVSVHITGTFGGAIVSLFGGNNIDNIDVILMQVNNTSASVTDSDVFSLLDRPLYIKPATVNGSGSSISVYMMVKYLFN